MKFVSTRNSKNSVTFSEAVKIGLASDGGLFVPESFPYFDLKQFSGTESIQEIAQVILNKFIQDDPLLGQPEDIKKFIQSAFDFPIPLNYLNHSTAILELFHGPTAAFKDIGAKFLSACLTRLAEVENKKYTILVATSGDTGGAVASAFNLNDRFEVVVLFPKGKVSSLQEKQLTCWGNNVISVAVNGNFDDCQKLVKSAFSNSWWKTNRNLTSANSINLARILPQSIYYAAASLWYFHRTGSKPGFVIPSGNLGNGVAALWAKEMGFPIRWIIFATNENRPIVDYLENKGWNPQPTKTTLANAMDVGNPSNMERLMDLYPDVRPIRNIANGLSVSDSQIKETIKDGPKDWGQVWCPHTATAVFARTKLKSDHWIIVSTAHPAKFLETVQPLINQKVVLPASLEALYKRQSCFYEIEPTDEALRDLLIKKSKK
jgi:threonine synthase